MSRTVNGEFLFAAEDCELFRVLMRIVGEYCGVEILTYAILSNHFHLLVRVPEKQVVSDDELIRRYQVLHPGRTKHHLARVSAIKAALASNSSNGQMWRERQLRRMNDISLYLQMLKQSFSREYNRRHGRFGTLWSERFKSVLVEPGVALQTVAAYIDLNCIRARLVEDPKEYRFCGYAEAIGGSHDARAGIAWILGQPWAIAAGAYRLILFGSGSAPRSLKGQIGDKAFSEAMRSGGKLTASEMLRCRVRYFTDGGILGGKRFIQDVAERSQGFLNKAKSFTPVLDWKELFTYRRPRGCALV